MEEEPDTQRSRQSRSEELQRRPLLRSSNGERNAILNSTEGRIDTSRSNAGWKDRRSPLDGTSLTDIPPSAGCRGSSDASVTQSITTQNNDEFVTIKKDQELVSGVPREKLQQLQQLFPWITNECTRDPFLMETIQELIPLPWIPKEKLHELQRILPWIPSEYTGDQILMKKFEDLIAGISSVGVYQPQERGRESSHALLVATQTEGSSHVLGGRSMAPSREGRMDSSVDQRLASSSSSKHLCSHDSPTIASRAYHERDCSYPWSCSKFMNGDSDQADTSTRPRPEFREEAGKKISGSWCPELEKGPSQNSRTPERSYRLSPLEVRSRTRSPSGEQKDRRNAVGVQGPTQSLPSGERLRNSSHDPVTLVTSQNESLPTGVSQNGRDKSIVNPDEATAASYNGDTVSAAASTAGASAPPVKYRGVKQVPYDKWSAEIRDPKKRKQVWLGSFAAPEGAASAYDKASSGFRGSRAVLNFPAESHAAAAAEAEAARASRSAISSTTQGGSSAAVGESAAPLEVPPVSRISTPTNPSTSSMIIHQHQHIQNVERAPLHQPYMDPVERLTSTIDSITAEALSSAVGELTAVRSCMNKLGASAPENGSRPRVGQGLASMARARLQSKAWMTQDDDTAMKRSRRMDSVALSLISPDGSDALNTLHRAGVETVDKVFTVTVPDLKSLKGKVPLALQEEIRQINDRLIDIEVEVGYEGSENAAAQGRDGVVAIVTCSYKPVAVRPPLAQIETADNLFAVRLLIPLSSPQSSLVFSSDCMVPNANFPSASGAGNVFVQEMQSARDDFERELVSLPAPIYLRTIAECWGRHARNALAKISTYHGGGTFSTNIGVWEAYA